MEKLLEDTTGSELELSKYFLIDLVECKEEMLIQSIEVAYQ